MIQYKLFGIVLIMICVSLLVACDPKTRTQEAAAPGVINEQGGEVTVKSITAKSISQFKDLSFEQSVLQTFEWDLSDGRSGKPSVDGIISQLTFGQYGAAVFQVTGTSKPYYFLALFRREEKEWIVHTGASIVVSTQSGDNKGLVLPMTAFATAALQTRESNEPNVRAFMNEKKHVVIGKYPKGTYPLPPDLVEVQLPDRTGWIKLGKKCSTLFYYNQDSLVWIVGNVTKEELSSLAQTVDSSGWFSKHPIFAHNPAVGFTSNPASSNPEPPSSSDPTSVGMPVGLNEASLSFKDPMLIQADPSEAGSRSNPISMRYAGSVYAVTGKTFEAAGWSSVSHREQDVFLISSAKGTVHTLSHLIPVIGQVRFDENVDAHIKKAVHLAWTGNEDGQFAYVFDQSKEYAAPEDVPNHRDFYGAIQYDTAFTTVERIDMYHVYHRDTYQYVMMRHAGKLRVCAQIPKAIVYARDF